MLKHGFKYNRIFSGADEDAYTYRFPVYKYEDVCTLECEIIIFLQSGIAKLNVYDYNTRNMYAPFYHRSYGNFDKILELINKRINKELTRLNIKKANKKKEYINGSKNKKIK